MSRFYFKNKQDLQLLARMLFSISKQNMIMKHLILILSASLMLFSCKKEREDVIMPDEIKDIYREFCVQASTRGVTLNFKSLHEIVLQGDIPQGQAETGNGVDVGGYYDHLTKKIYIDTTGVDYKHYKETLLFHELGHALLHREHRNDLFADNATPVSIMHWSFMAPLNHITSPYYFDEMFNTSTPYPYWVQGWK